MGAGYGEDLDEASRLGLRGSRSTADVETGSDAASTGRHSGLLAFHTGDARTCTARARVGQCKDIAAGQGSWLPHG